MIHLSEWGFHTARIACLEWLPGLGGQKDVKEIDLDRHRNHRRKMKRIARIATKSTNDRRSSLSIRQWVRSGIHASRQHTPPTGFLSETSATVLCGTIGI